MKRRSPAVVPFANPFLLWGTLGIKTMQMSTAAAQVIAIRGARMAAAGLNPSAADRRENVRMVTEKMDAFTRAGQALASGAAPLMMGLAAQALRTGFDAATASTAAARLAHRTLAPVHGKATANARRLAKKAR